MEDIKTDQSKTDQVQLNEKLINELAEKLKIDATQFNQAILNPDTEVNLDDYFILTKDQWAETKDRITKNSEKEFYESGKTNGVEALLRKKSRDLGFETHAKDIDTYTESLIEKVKNENIEKIKVLESKLEQTETEKDEQYKKQLHESNQKLINLQKTLEDTVREKDIEYQKLQERWTQSKCDDLINKNFSILNFSIPNSIKNKDDQDNWRKINLSEKQSIFKQNFDIEFLENGLHQLRPKFQFKYGNKIIDPGQVITDQFEKPIMIDQVLPIFAKNQYWLLQENKQNGRALDGKLELKMNDINLASMTLDDLNKYFEQEEIHPNSNKATAIMQKWKKIGGDQN